MIGAADLDLAALTGLIQPAFDAPLEVQRMVRDLRTSSSMLERLQGLQLAFSHVPADSLPSTVSGYLDQLPELSGGSLFLLRPNENLTTIQMSVARNLFRAEVLGHAIRESASNPRLLEGGLGLQSADSVGGAIYALLAVAVTTPHQLGVIAHRQAGTLLALFPRPLDDTQALHPSCLADLQRPRYFTRPRLDPTIIGRAEAGDADTFVPWWIGRWNMLLSELFDPSTHRARDGFFDPTLMLGRFFSHLRLLSCVQGILADTGRNDLGAALLE
jgi:hypothetical protein